MPDSSMWPTYELIMKDWMDHPKNNTALYSMLVFMMTTNSIFLLIAELSSSHVKDVLHECCFGWDFDATLLRR